MTYDEAYAQAIHVVAQLAPFCVRCEIAGSIRRRKPHPKDIEVVAHPSRLADGLFDDHQRVHPGFCAIVNRWTRLKGEPTGRYTQRRLPSGAVLDLFMADADNYGSIVLIRTGDAAFSKDFMGRRLRRAGFEQREGYVWRKGQKVRVAEERMLFELVGMPYLEPWNRCG
jgi:DNA polymerase/3'-5' exonuclease PolX